MTNLYHHLCLGSILSYDKNNDKKNYLLYLSLILSSIKPDTDHLLSLGVVLIDAAERNNIRLNILYL